MINKRSLYFKVTIMLCHFVFFLGSVQANNEVRKAKDLFDLFDGIKNLIIENGPQAWINSGKAVDNFVINMYHRMWEHSQKTKFPIEKIEETFLGNEIKHGYKTADGRYEIWLQKSLSPRKGSVDVIVWEFERDNNGTVTKIKGTPMDHHTHPPTRVRVKDKKTGNWKKVPSYKKHWDSKVKTFKGWIEEVREIYPKAEVEENIDYKNSYYWARGKLDKMVDLERKIIKAQQVGDNKLIAKLKKRMHKLVTSSGLNKRFTGPVTLSIFGILSANKKLMASVLAGAGSAAYADTFNKILDAELALYKCPALLKLAEMVKTGDRARAYQFKERIKRSEPVDTHEILKKFHELSPHAGTGQEAWEFLIDKLYDTWQKALFEQEELIKLGKSVSVDFEIEGENITVNWDAREEPEDDDWIGIYDYPSCGYKDYFYWEYVDGPGSYTYRNRCLQPELKDSKPEIRYYIKNDDGDWDMIKRVPIWSPDNPSMEKRAVSSFDGSTEGWKVVGDAQLDSSADPILEKNAIKAVDHATGGVWFWKAPQTYNGDKRNLYGLYLVFRLKTSAVDNQFDYDDIVLSGGGLTIVYDTKNNPDLDWTPYRVRLHESDGWIIKETGKAATREQMLQVLSDVTQLLIRGEFRTGADTGWLDNVVFGTK